MICEDYRPVTETGSNSANDPRKVKQLAICEIDHRF